MTANPTGRNTTENRLSHTGGTSASDTDADDFRQTSLGYLVNHAARLLEAALRSQVVTLGVSPGEMPALLCLFDEDGLTQKQLCARVDISQATMALTLGRMERDGLIARAPDPDDGRSSLIMLTPQARDLREDLLRLARETNETATRGLSPARREDLIDGLHQIIGNLTEKDSSSK